VDEPVHKGEQVEPTLYRSARLTEHDGVDTSLGAVLGRRALDLRHVAGPLDAGRPVRWVAVSELTDPTPYLEGGELLLTTGMELPVHDPAGVAAYVERIRRRGVVALGLGTGVRHDEPPAALVEAVEALGLPLIEVPPRTPFIAVTRAVADLVAHAEREDVTRSLEAHRRLARAALREDGVDGVIRELARLLAGWAVVTDATGAVEHAAGEVPEQLRQEVAREIDRLVPQGLRGAAGVTGADGPFVVYPLGTAGPPRWYIAAGRGTAFDMPARNAVTACVSLLSLSLSRGGATDPGRRRLRRAAADRLLEGRTDAADALLEVLGGGAPAVDGEFVVLVADRAGDDDAVQVLADDPALADCLVTSASGELVVLTAAPRAVVDRAAETLRSLGGVVGVSRPTRRADVPRALLEARSARAAGERSGGPAHFQGLVADGVPALVDGVAARGWADALLAPLHSYVEAGGGVDLVQSLRSYLAHHGQWQPAAAELGVHRHTLRHRMARVEQLLGTSLSSPQARMNLWFALQSASADRAAAPHR
jgi:purine catabolism regulator